MNLLTFVALDDTAFGNSMAPLTRHVPRGSRPVYFVSKRPWFQTLANAAIAASRECVPSFQVGSVAGSRFLELISTPDFS
jgi:hypothetical protein